MVYISGYSPTLERRRPLGEPAAVPAPAVAEVHDTTAAYRTLPSKQKRLQQFYAAASSADVGPCGPSAGEGEQSIATWFRARLRSRTGITGNGRR